MRIELEVPDYDRALVMHWDPGFEIRVTEDDGEVHIQANRPGLISLARLMLTLLDEKVPDGSHWHLGPMPHSMGAVFTPDSTISLIVSRLGPPQESTC